MRTDLFPDPKNGVGYSTNEVFPSEHGSAVLSGMRSFEEGAYTRVSITSDASPSGISSPDSITAAAFDEALNLWVIGWYEDSQSASRLEFAPPAGNFRNDAAVSPSYAVTGFTPRAGASNGSGTILIGGGYAGSSASKVLRSTDGITWSTETTTTSDTKDITTLAWDPKSALFVAGISAGEIETSPDGQTWTARTVPGALSSATWVSCASNERTDSGSLILLFPSSGTSYLSSPDAITWTERTFPQSFGSTESSVTYCIGLGIWAAVGDDETVYTSSDGINWTATAGDPPGFAALGGANGLYLASVGDAIFISYTANDTNFSSSGVIAFTLDGGITWRMCNSQTSGTPAVKLYEAPRQILAAKTRTVLLSGVA